MTFKIWVALEILQYLDNHEPQRFDLCIECTPTDRNCQLYHHQVKILFTYEGTHNLVSGAFLKCFSIVGKYSICMRLSQIFWVGGIFCDKQKMSQKINIYRVFI